MNTLQQIAETKLWPLVQKSDGCWMFTGKSRNSDKPGSGHRRVIITRSNRVYAHRFSWELHNGPIPAGIHVLHRCDNPPCVRPDHLFLGTDLDNMRDMIAKGRANHPVRYGDGANHTIIPDSDIPLIRAEYVRGTGRYNRGNSKEIAARYGVSSAVISGIANRGMRSPQAEAI